MVRISPRPSPVEQVSRAVDDTTERARGRLEAFAERPGRELASTVDASAVASGLRRVLAGAEAERCDQVETARDKERLKAALIAAVVLFALSSVVFVVAREIATRRSRVARTTLRPPLTPPGMVVVDERSDETAET